jgi:allantoicase
VKEPPALGFTGLVDLAAAELGGKAVATSDEYFAGADNLLRPGRGVFLPDEYTDRGKWMDGWESRRKRTAGHDWCILSLGVTGRVSAFDIDTNHFNGNHPSFASVEGLLAPKRTAVDELVRSEWRQLMPQAPLMPTAQNLFVAKEAGPISHVRLSIFPDGGVARFRVFGSVVPDFEEREIDEATRQHVGPELVDLGALKNGGLPVACSDARFGPMNQLLLPGRAENMSSGWETRRNRIGARDWLVVKLGARGMLRVVEVDTSHFKGNFPDRCSLHAIDAPEARITDLIASDRWTKVLPETRLHAHTRHFFSDVLLPHAPASHVRLDVFPDGGLSRLRLWGTRDG